MSVFGFLLGGLPSPPPPAIRKTISALEDKIKLEGPTPLLSRDLRAGAKNWGTAVRSISQKHLAARVDELAGELVPHLRELTTKEFGKSLELAVLWSKRRYGKRLGGNVISKFRVYSAVFDGNLRDAKSKKTAPPKEGPTVSQTDTTDSYRWLKLFRGVGGSSVDTFSCRYCPPCSGHTLQLKKKKRNSVESRTKRKKKFRPSRLDLRPVDAGQTEEADSPTNLDGTDGISQLSPSSPASVVDESLLLASQGTAGEFSQTLHESLLNSPLAGNSPETSTQAGGLVTAPTMAVSPPLLTEDTNRSGSSAGPEEELRIMVLPSRDVCPTPVALYYLVGVSSSPGDGVGAVSRQMITHSLCPNLFQ